MRKCWPAAAALCGTVSESCHAGSSSQPTRPLPLLPLYLPAPSMQGLCVLFCIPAGSGSEGKSVWVPRLAARAARSLVAQVGVQKHCLLSHWYGVNAHVNTTPGGIPTAVCGHWELFCKCLLSSPTRARAAAGLYKGISLSPFLKSFRSDHVPYKGEGKSEG